MMQRRRVFFQLLLVVLALSTWCGGSAADDRALKRKDGAEARTALVIGNGGYPSALLKNPGNDAKEMEKALRASGFEVALHVDATYQEMDLAVMDFGKRLRERGGVGLFYFAGHGIQVGGRNYLIPVDARIESESDVKFKAIDAGRALGKMEDAGNELNIVILDACRNNPFARSFRSAEQGLARMDAPTGSLIAYATAPGSVAADGEGKNGIYTRNLLAHLATPGLKLEEVLKRVRSSVLAETDRRQVPWESSSIVGDFYFRGGPTLPPPVVREPSGGGTDKEALFWQAIANSTDPAMYEAYLAQYPSGTFTELARLKIRQLPPAGGVRKPSAGPAQPGTPSQPAGDTTWTEPVTGMEFVWVEGGCFMMGSPSSEAGRSDDEGPQHEVCVDGFYMGKYEVTQGEWRKIMGNNPAKFQNGDRYPVEMVSWDDAQDFIAGLGSRSGQTFRLPTEAEWEYAARAGTSTPFSFGTTISTDQANYDGNYTYGNGRKGQYREKTTPVGSFPANQFGLYDMHGNVWEWCGDWYGERYYGSSPRNNPQGPSKGSNRVDRGGSWSSLPRNVRAASRFGNTPGGRNAYRGFRLVLPAPRSVP